MILSSLLQLNFCHSYKVPRGVFEIVNQMLPVNVHKTFVADMVGSTFYIVN